MCVHFSSLESFRRLLLAYGHVLLQLDAFLLNYQKEKFVTREVCLLSFAKVYAHSSIYTKYSHTLSRVEEDRAFMSLEICYPHLPPWSR